MAASDGDEATHVSLYDGTVEGFDLPDVRPARCSSTPRQAPVHDAWPILEAWVEEIADAR